MPQAVSFAAYTPAARFDAISWSEARIEESATEDGTFTQIDVIPFASVTPAGADPDPANPLARSFTTQLGGDTEGLWYRVVFADADGTTSTPTSPVQNSDDDVAAVTYATTTELARILKIRTVSAEQEIAMQRCLDTAAGEIASEIDLTSSLSETWQVALATEVNLERAVEHWRQQESPFGLIGLGPEMPAERTAHDSWNRHAHKLAPLKARWGLA